jgi:hypothetical protein
MVREISPEPVCGVLFNEKNSILGKLYILPITNSLL